MKTKESIAAYNKEYFSRPEVKARAKIRNAKYRARRKLYKKTQGGVKAEKRYRTSAGGKEKQKESRLRSRYGIELIDVALMRLLQSGACRICSKDIHRNKYHVDHSHITGEVRGLLCVPCNMGLGLFKDDATVLVRAIKYLNNELPTDISTKAHSETKQEA